MDKHLPKIHEVMCQTVQDEQLVRVANYNELLSVHLKRIMSERESQRQQHTASQDLPPAEKASDIMNSGKSTESRAARQNSGQPASTGKPQNEEVEKCSHCKRRLRSRGVYCELGSHWIHYNCDNLSPVEIKRLHNDPGDIFNCKECVKSNENTAVKVVSESSTITSPVRTLTIPPCVSSHDKSPVAAILEEERGDVCSVCDMTVEGELRKRCSLCSMMVHSRCTTEEDEEVCLNCAAAEDQHKQVHVQSAITLDDEGEFNDSVSMVQEPGRPDVKPAEKPLEPTSANRNVQPMSTGTNSPKINTNELKDVVLSNNSDSTQPGASQKTTLVPKVVKDTTKPAKGRQITTESVSAKQRELRQLETKLKKWE